MTTNVDRTREDTDLVILWLKNTAKRLENGDIKLDHARFFTGPNGMTLEVEAFTNYHVVRAPSWDNTHGS